MTWNEIHPAINAVLNGLSAVFLITGYIAVRRGQVDRHWRWMLAAFASSTVFLISYLARYAISGTHRYPGSGWDKWFYLIVLFSHMVLAAVVLPMILRVLWLAWKKRHDQHRRLARWAWPIWIYVSATGVIVYLMLYPVASTLYGR